VRRIAFATCAAFPSLHDDDRRLVAPLEALGLRVEPVLWDDPGARWADYEAVVLRSTWDYFERPAEFRAWLDGAERDGARLLNDPAIVRGNLDKAYLKALAAAGVETAPTVWLEQGDARPAAALLEGVPWDDLVVKPSVSAGAWRTRHASRDALRADDAYFREVLRDSAALVQPFLREVVERGEWSFLYFGGRYSHAVLKRAKAGDFRVQFTHGGRHERAEPAPRLREAADDVFLRLAGDCLYTRVAGVEVGGRLVVLEVERIEPYLFVGECPEAPARFAAALAERLAPRRAGRRPGPRPTMSG
jgi:glutathione synthase/RimK-type ligase-like ATP-grasp enzyme